MKWRCGRNLCLLTHLSLTTTFCIDALSSYPKSGFQRTAGIAEVLESMECGDSLRGFRRSVLNNEKHEFTIERVANSPQLFVIRGFCRSLECKAIRDHVSNSVEMDKAQTWSGESDKRTNCNVAWLENQAINSLIGSLAQAAGNVLISDNVKKSSRLGCEDLQVLKYSIDGEYVLHHDGNNRILTVIYYLNGIGSTWFPFATSERKLSTNVPTNLLEAKTMSADFSPDSNGILVSCNSAETSKHCISIQEGDAVAFFNYSLEDVDGKLGLACDWSSFHAGLPASSTKWIANHWFRTA